MTEKTVDRLISAVQAIVIAAIAALASYYSATSEAREGSSASNKRADIGYETLVKNIEELQKEVSELRALRWIDDTAKSPMTLPTALNDTAWMNPPLPLDQPPPTLKEAVDAVGETAPAAQ
jgi:hypothetical protein